jgi:hypothetical protein
VSPSPAVIYINLQDQISTFRMVLAKIPITKEIPATPKLSSIISVKDLLKELSFTTERKKVNTRIISAAFSRVKKRAKIGVLKIK